MVLVVVDGVKRALPLAAPLVYTFSEGELEGGTAAHLAEQVIKAMSSTHY